MSSKLRNEGYCDRFNKQAHKTRCLKRAVPKRVIKSREVENCSENAKSCSTGIIHQPSSNKGRKCTRSDLTIANRNARKESIDFCKKCGDQIQSKSEKSTSSTQSGKSTHTRVATSDSGNESRSRTNEVQKISRNASKTKPVKQYFRNENFQSSVSIQEAEMDFRKISLDTIKEVPDVSESTVNIYDVFSDSEEEIGFLDINDRDNINEMKKFRDKNYFECHSVKSKIDNKASVTSLIGHKCAYRFYLNDRLFPVPVSTDYDDSVRCVECYLPIDYNSSDTPNGTIQAKVRINNENQDMILLLPVKESLVIKEKRKEIKENNEVMYFGVVKLNSYGNSVFNTTMPSDSLALKYQKGYREYRTREDYRYDSVERGDVIVI